MSLSVISAFLKEKRSFEKKPIYIYIYISINILVVVHRELFNPVVCVLSNKKLILYYSVFVCLNGKKKQHHQPQQQTRNFF